VIGNYKLKKADEFGLGPGHLMEEHKKQILQGLKSQGIIKGDILLELRVDGGSHNTSLVTKEFFDTMGADLSSAVLLQTELEFSSSFVNLKRGGKRHDRETEEEV
jgi:hypothetical protein